MYKLANGWTKETVMEQVRKYNNGAKSVRTSVDWYSPNDPPCTYLAPDGNRCAIGCFIPDGHPALNSFNGVKFLIQGDPSLKPFMPFDDCDALEAFQNAHDESLKGKVYDSIQNFLNDWCEE